MSEVTLFYYYRLFENGQTIPGTRSISQTAKRGNYSGCPITIGSTNNNCLHLGVTHAPNTMFRGPLDVIQC